MASIPEGVPLQYPVIVVTVGWLYPALYLRLLSVRVAFLVAIYFAMRFLMSNGNSGPLNFVHVEHVRSIFPFPLARTDDCGIISNEYVQTN